jgi:hypothetical protein
MQPERGYVCHAHENILWIFRAALIGVLPVFGSGIVL